MNEVQILIMLIVIFVVSLFILFFPKIKAFFCKLFKISSKGKKKKGKKTKGKIKPSVTQQTIRPIVKPPKEYGEVKLLEHSEVEKLPEPQQKVLEYKYTNRKPVTKLVDEYEQGMSGGRTQEVRTTEEKKKEFDEIKNFLKLPEGFNNNTSAAKASSSSYKYSADSSKIDPSLFGAQESYMMNYKPKASAPVTSVPTKQMRTQTKYSKPVSFDYGYKNNNGDFDITKKPNFTKQELDNINARQTKALSSNYMNLKDDGIDLNKLPPNLKRFIINNILARKNFD